MTPSNRSEHIFSSRIIIVDDNEVNRLFLQKALSSRGFNHLLSVDSAEAALKALPTYKPELVILDLIMPGMNGFECCQEIRKMPEGQDLPILIQTVITEPEQRFKAFEKGATDFISKPIFADELYARVLVHLEKRLALKELQLYKRRVEAELIAARELQQAILPDKAAVQMIESQCGLDIGSYFDPSSEIGGDFWGIKRLFPHQIAFWIVDFSGHGVAAALNAFRLQAYLMEHSQLASRPGEYLSQMNEKLLHLMMKGQFATMFYGIIDIQSNTLFYASAGSPHPIILRDGKPELVDASGMLMGVGINQYTTRSVEFNVGDSIMFYSDALTETKTKDGSFLEESMLMQWLSEARGDAKDALAQLLAHFQSRVSADKRDDLTVGYIRRQAISK